MRQPFASCCLLTKEWTIAASRSRPSAAVTRAKMDIDQVPKRRAWLRWRPGGLGLGWPMPEEVAGSVGDCEMGGEGVMSFGDACPLPLEGKAWFQSRLLGRRDTRVESGRDLRPEGRLSTSARTSGSMGEDLSPSSVDPEERLVMGKARGLPEEGGGRESRRVSNRRGSQKATRQRASQSH